MTRAPTRRRNDPAQKRAQILAEAVRLLAEEGFYRFTVEELARRSGVSKGGLLYHFRTKEELFLAVLVEYERRMEEAGTAVAERFVKEPRDRATRAKALALLRGMVEQSAAEPELMRLFAVLQAEALHRGHPAHDYFQQLQQRIVSGLGRIVADLTDEPAATARALYALMMGLEYQWLRTHAGFDYLREWDRAVELLLPDTGARER